MQRFLIGAAVAATGLAAVPALAHVTVAPASAPAGAYQVLAFKVGHGCDGSATTGITVQIPDGVVGAKPMPKPGWTIVLTEGKLATPVQAHGKAVTSAVREIAWRGGPLPDAYYDEFVLQVKLPDTPGPYVFKVGQACENGRNDWVEVEGAGKFPAPVLDVTAPDPHAGHHH